MRQPVSRWRFSRVGRVGGILTVVAEAGGGSGSPLVADPGSGEGASDTGAGGVGAAALPCTSARCQDWCAGAPRCKAVCSSAVSPGCSSHQRPAISAAGSASHHSLEVAFVCCVPARAEPSIVLAEYADGGPSDESVNPVGSTGPLRGAAPSAAAFQLRIRSSLAWAEAGANGASARAKSWTDAKRSSGDLLRQRMTTSLNGSGSSTRCFNDVGSTCSTAPQISDMDSASNGESPVISS